MINVTRNGRVVHLTIDAPPVNVLDTAVMAGLTEEIGNCAADESIAGVTIRGEGKCFSAGASVAEHRPPKAESMVTALLDACTALGVAVTAYSPEPQPRRRGWRPLRS